MAACQDDSCSLTQHDLDEVSKQLEIKRAELNRLGENYELHNSNCCTELIIKVSQELDILIVRYHELTKKINRSQ